MLFNSLDFLIFFPLVVALYFSIPHKFRWAFLLVASYYFYMSWKPEYAFLIILSTLIDYLAALKMEGKKKKERWPYLTLSLISNLGLLIAFKYFNFFSDSIREIFYYFSIPINPLYLKVLLPVGISFYTFQTLSYTIDVYRGKIKAERHLGIFALYVSFFPQLVAGPIERAKNLLPQFFQKHNFSFDRTTDGLKLMLWGFFKKIVIADRLAPIVDSVYANPSEYSGFTLILATVFFAFQIYCDFSGYSDIAIGTAKILGFDLMNNFRRPYFSRSIDEFWKRWHISLSSWFKDYLYIPLGGNRVPVPRWYFNLFLVFLISGLWHGANWTFVFWGALNGIYLISEIVLKPIKRSIIDKSYLRLFPKATAVLEIIFTFLLVNLGWVFFRSENLKDAFSILTGFFKEPFHLNITSEINAFDLIVAFSAIIIMETVHLIQEKQGIKNFLGKQPLIVRWSLYTILVWIILLFGAFGEKQFIYFQF